MNDRVWTGEINREAAIDAEVGFYDQAHLTRRFRRFLGTTPGQYRAGSLRA